MLRALLLIATVALVAACGTRSTDRALSGAGAGAGAGALVGGPIGALVGGAAGAVTGAVTEPDDVYLGRPVWR